MCCQFVVTHRQNTRRAHRRIVHSSHLIPSHPFQFLLALSVISDVSFLLKPFHRLVSLYCFRKITLSPRVSVFEKEHLQLNLRLTLCFFRLVQVLIDVVQGNPILCPVIDALFFWTHGTRSFWLRRLSTIAFDRAFFCCNPGNRLSCPNRHGARFPPFPSLRPASRQARTTPSRPWSLSRPVASLSVFFPTPRPLPDFFNWSFLPAKRI